jgi:hypothetical protein
VNSHPLITLLVPTLVAVISWFIGSWLAVRRDRANKRRDLRVQYLIDAYRRLAIGANRTPPSASHLNDIESALEDVQLFGTAAQVEAAHELARNVAERGEATADGLLTLLRDDLRKELRLEAMKSPRIFLRFTDKKTK